MKHVKKFKLFEYAEENPVNMNYRREIPRDLFNEAKLLKCVGRLILLIHNNDIPEGFEMSFKHNGKPFKIGLMRDGSLTVDNVQISVNGIPCVFKTTYNSKSNFPFYLEYELTDYPVFTDKGEFDEEYIEIAKTIAK